jgi:LysM repeat protein
MTDETNTRAKPVGRARTQGPWGYGKGTVVAAGVAAAVLIPLLIASGISAAGAMTAQRAVHTAQAAEALPTSDAGDESPGTKDPATPPDRDSDQTVVPPQEDTIYYIQEGDTLTALSAKFGQSIDSIANYNAVRDVNVISEGAVLRVPFIYLPPAAVLTQ